MEFYQKVRATPMARAWLYVTGFLSFMTLVVSLVVILPGMLSLRDDIRGGINHLAADTWFEIRDGQFNTNLPPATEFQFDGNVVLILDSTVEGLELPQSFAGRIGALVGRDALFAQDPQGKQETILFKNEISDFKVTGQVLQTWVDRWSLPLVILGTIFSAVSKFVLIFLTSAIFVLPIALIVKFAGQIAHLKMNYSQWLAVSLHAITLPTIIDFVFTLLDWKVPLVFIAVFFMIICAVFIDEKTRSAKKS
jgi:hypothetical protein